MKEDRIVCFLYGTSIGRLILRFLINPRISRIGSKFLSLSISSYLVPVFIKAKKINMSRYEIPENGFLSFNDFFTRRLKDGYTNPTDSRLIAPSDGLLSLVRITDRTTFTIKHSTYTVESLLRDKNLANEYSGGTALIFRLTPAHFHRYVFCADAELVATRRIEGVLHSVRPVCMEHYKVFTENSREYAVLDTAEFGTVVQMEIGAMLVGKISNHPVSPGEKLFKGKEKGYFEYGGSTVLLLLKSTVALKGDLAELCDSDKEIPVVIGDTLI